MNEVTNERHEQDHEHGKPPEPMPPKNVTVKINNNDVTFEDHKATGLQIKQTAIQQGVNIKEDFALFEEKGGGNEDKEENLKPIDDNDTVTLHPNQRFRAVSPDDSSSPELSR